MTPKHTTAIYVKINSDVKIVEDDDFNRFLTTIREKIAKALTIDIEEVQIEKLIQEEPLWTNPDLDAAVAEA